MIVGGVHDSIDSAYKDQSSIYAYKAFEVIEE
jgi:hypothetical protein